ncbi:MAG: universal stress protein, partial [Nitrospirota bacterium]|nr:universal stress protein [Nitrospirota bacterium]
MKLLLATDGSKYSETAAKFLTHLTFSPDDEITILHVIGWVPPKGDIERYYAGLKELKQELAPKIIDHAVNILKPVNAKMNTLLAEGEPDKSIIEAAANADLVVLGEKGVMSIKSLLIGSVTRSVAIGSPKSVFVIKPPQERAGKMKILFATDGFDYSDAAGKLLTLLPFPDNSEITILNVIWSALSDIPERFVTVINDRIKENVAKARSIEFAESERIIDKARDYLRKRFKTINVLTKVGDPFTHILNSAETLHADVVAIGCRGIRGVKGMLGSVSRNVLSRS